MLQKQANQFLIVGLGEVLWDILPDGKQLGGAPANFAYASKLLGDQAIIASRIGTDELGREIHERLTELGLRTDYLQRDETRPTGTVHVQVDKDGQPFYSITENVAWDFLEWTGEWEDLAARADAVCFGSLAQRWPDSYRTIRRFLQTTRRDALRVFDVNLRQSFYSTDLLRESLGLSNIVKLNHEELPRVAELLYVGGRGEYAWANRLIQVFDLKLVCITRGARGSLIVTEEEMHEHPGIQVKVVDTVGTGDAFTASLVHHYLRGETLQEISDAANRIGAWMATQSGATPPAESFLGVTRRGSK